MPYAFRHMLRISLSYPSVQKYENDKTLKLRLVRKSLQQTDFIYTKTNHSCETISDSRTVWLSRRWLPTVFVSTENMGFRDRIFPKMRSLTAASSGRNAPFAMLCFPGRTLCADLEGSLSPSVGVSKASHSSLVATWPHKREKNLWRKIVLILSKPCAVYQPSLSCCVSFNCGQ